MKKIYLLALTILCSLTTKVAAQTCTAPPPPLVSGNTLIACTSSAVFTLTANAQPTNSVMWFQGTNIVSQSSVYVTPAVTSTASYSVGQVSGTTTQTLTMPSHASSYGSTVRGYWFQSPMTFTITGVWVPVDVGTGNANVAIVDLGSTPPSYPTTSNSFTVLFLVQNQPGVGVMAVNIPVVAGQFIGVLGSRGNLTSYGTSPYISSFGTNTMTITRLGMQYNLNTTAPQDLWTESGGSVGRVFLYGTAPCISSLTPVTLSISPNAVISVATSTTKICAGSSVTMSAQGMNTYTWSNASQATGIVVSPNATTIYSVTGSSGGTCTANSAVTISVDPGLPPITANPSQNAICIGSTVSLTGGGNSNNTYTWTGGIANAAMFSPTATAGYTVSGANSCGTGSATIIVTVNPVPSINTTSFTTVCDGAAVTLTASGANSYVWMPGNLTGSMVVVTPNVPTPYVVTGMNQFSCTSTANAVVLVYPNPTVTAGASQTAVCPNGTVTLNASGSGGTYSWSTGGSGQTTVVSLQQQSVFTVSLTNQYSCTSSASVSVGVHQPTISISPPTGVCPGAAATLTAGAAQGYTWNTVPPNFGTVTVNPSTTTLYTLTALVNMGNVSCIATNSVLVTVNPNPTVTISTVKTIVCKNEQGQIQAGGASTYVWTNSSATVSALTVTFTQNGLQTYSVTGTDANGCKSGASLTVQVNACNGLEEWNLPDLFTAFPNPTSGALFISAERNMHLILFNSLGQRVSEIALTETNGFSAQLHGLADGVYFLCGNENRQVKRIVVTK
jgi:hypothetical protein